MCVTTSSLRHSTLHDALQSFLSAAVTVHYTVTAAERKLRGLETLAKGETNKKTGRE
jgi:hypothetical protein